MLCHPGGGTSSAAETTTHYENQSVLTRGCVRSAIRNAILDLGESVASYMGTDDGAKGSANAAGSAGKNAKDKGGGGDVLVHQTAVIDVFEALHILVRIVALRRRPVEDKLRRLYVLVWSSKRGRRHPPISIIRRCPGALCVLPFFAAA